MIAGLKSNSSLTYLSPSDCGTSGNTCMVKRKLSFSARCTTTMYFSRILEESSGDACARTLLNCQFASRSRAACIPSNMKPQGNLQFNFSNTKFILERDVFSFSLSWSDEWRKDLQQSDASVRQRAQSFKRRRKIIYYPVNVTCSYKTLLPILKCFSRR